MIEILIKNKETESVDQKKVPLSWTISNLKNYFAKVQKIPVPVLIFNNLDAKTLSSSR